MKLNLSKICAGLLIAVIGFMAQPLHAQDAPPPGGGGPADLGGHMGFLTKEQRDQLRKARVAAFAADPDLQTQKQALDEQGKALHDNANATDADKQAFHDKKKAFDEALSAAELKQDPTLQPVLDEIKKHMQEMHHGGGGNPPPPAN